uniref:histidine kinase n=1 Tax=Candidatus Kentrum sp. MB TaxID=2138164 RepID=A0A451BB97_9GAMM|nr:MAG: Histidine kinase-, DNA gyrase B-, and HSP90-like ATPase [Candidatus Kentron sp. MB]VFK75535.1 MAG: Histidine kinase-, DNA gyrase B-, and HSP90-like ATPase [Candidatus Kentron sp. MB]
MSRISLLTWLSENRSIWAWQTILDTLAFAEGVPLRLVDAGCLQNFHECLRSVCSDDDVQAIINEKFPQYGSLHDAFDNYIGSRRNFSKKIKKWVRRARTVRDDVVSAAARSDMGAKPVFSKEELQLFDAAFPFFGRKIFKTFTSNAILPDFLSKLVMPHWRWYRLLWLYHEFVIKGRLEAGQQDGSWNVCETAFEVPGLYFAWSQLKTNPNLLLLVGPVFDLAGSSTARNDWSSGIPHAATFLAEFHRKVEGRDSALIQEQRFLRAIQSEPSIPLPNLELSASRVIGALMLLNTLTLPEQSWEPRSSELRLMALWALFVNRRREYLSLAYQQYMSAADGVTVALRREIDPSGEGETASRHVLSARITATGIALDMVDEAASGFDSPPDNNGFGFELSLLESSLGDTASLELLEWFSVHFCQLLTHFNRHATLFNSERALILNEWLQNHLGTLIRNYPDAADRYANSAHRICARVAELVRADVTILYEYDTVGKAHGVLDAIGTYFADPFHRKYARALKEEIRAIADPSNPNRQRSVCYRAIDEHREKIIFDYDKNADRSSPHDESIYVFQGDHVPVFRSTIAIPIAFNGRIFALIEVNALKSWRFRAAQLRSLQEIASTLSPFLYQHRYLQALQGIQETILRFHARGNPKQERENKFYNKICKLLTGLFLCDGSAIWVRDTGNTDRFFRKGRHNIKRQDEEFYLGRRDSFAGKQIEDFERGGADMARHFNVDCEDPDQPILRREELRDGGIKTLTVVLVLNQKDKVMAAIMLYGKGAHQPYDESWSGIMHFIGSYLSVVVEAVNSFLSDQKNFEASLVHEVYHDATFIAYKGKKLAHSMQGLRDGVGKFIALLTDPRFRAQLDTGVLGLLGPAPVDDLKELSRQFDSRLFLVDKDLEYYSDTLSTRVQTLFGKISYDVPQKAKEFLQATGDERLMAELMRSIDWQEKENWTPLRGIYLGIKEGNQKIRGKGLYVDFDEGDFRHLEIFVQRTAMTTVFRNLFTNATKYSLPNESVTIALRKVGGGMLSLTIQNKGHGFTEQGETMRVLRPEYRGSNAKKIEGEIGLGMGLYIVNQLCRHILGIGFRFWDEPKGNGISVFHAELLLPENKVRYPHEYGFRS